MLNALLLQVSANTIDDSDNDDNDRCVNKEDGNDNDEYDTVCLL